MSGTASPRAVLKTRHLAGFCIAQSKALRCTLAQSNEPGSGSKVIVAVKWNSHCILGSGSSLEIICFFNWGEECFHSLSSCILFMGTLCNNKNYISWQKQWTKNQLEEHYTAGIYFSGEVVIYFKYHCALFHCGNPQRKQQNASDGFIHTETLFKSTTPKQVPWSTSLLSPRHWFFTDLSQSVHQWRECPQKLLFCSVYPKKSISLVS